MVTTISCQNANGSMKFKIQKCTILYKEILENDYCGSC